MSPEEGSFNDDQFIVSENEGGVEIDNLSGSSDVLSENHVEGGAREGRESPYSSSPSLGYGIDIPSPSLLQLSEDMIESVVDNTQHVNASQPCPVLIAIAAPPTNQLFPSMVEPVQQEQNFVTVGQADGRNFAYQDRSMMPPNNTFNPDNSFQMDAEMINDQDITFSRHDPANNGLSYISFEIPSPNWPPELQDSAGRLQLPPFNHLSDSQLGARIGVGIQNNGTNFVGATKNWANAHDNSFGSKDNQFQQDSHGGMDGQGSFYLGGSTPNQVQFANMPCNPDGNQGGNFVNSNLFDAGRSPSMMGMNMHNGMTLAQNGMALAPELQQSGFFDQDGNYISNMQHMRRLTRNSVYDPSYEAMGLPLDPHLRIFLSQRGHDGLENPAGKPNNAGRNI